VYLCSSYLLYIVELVLAGFAVALVKGLHKIRASAGGDPHDGVECL
jgi:hypothetical protein